MRSSRLFSCVIVCAAIGFGCSSSSDDTSPTTTDSGAKKDSSSSFDSTSEDTGGGVDSSVTDSSTMSDTKSDGGGGTCSHHPGDECDMVKQDCTDKTQTCEYDATAMHNKCSARALGTGLAGDACTSSSGCDRGLFCYRGACSPACCPGDNSVCGTKGTCDLAITDTTGSATLYYVCDYAALCHAFEYDCPSGQVCLYKEAPDTYRCADPLKGLATKPGGPCAAANDCGESQLCTAVYKTGEDAAAAPSLCYLTCYLSTPTGFMPGTSPGGRFPANGTCTVSGTSYGTCTDVGLGGGLGLCVK